MQYQREELSKRAATTAFMNTLGFAAITIGGLWFGIYLRWMFYLLCLMTLVHISSATPGTPTAELAPRAAKLLGAVPVALAFSLAIFNVFGIVGFPQLFAATGASLFVSGMLWLLSMGRRAPAEGTPPSS